MDREGADALATGEGGHEPLNALLDQMPAAVATFAGPRHVFTFANQIYRRSFGDRHFLGRPFEDALPELADARAWLDEVYRTGQPTVVASYPVTLNPGSGVAETRYWKGNILPTRGADGAVSGVMVVAFDITAEVRANEALRASEEQVRALNDELTEAVRARDTFLSIASHELRTPLTTLLLQAQSLLARESDGRLRPIPEEQLVRRLALVERQGRRLERLVEELLNVTQITSGRFEVEVEDVDVAAVAAEVVARAADDAERAGCTIALRGDRQALVRSDRRHLDRVIDNLVTNAIKYGDGRPIEVRVEAGDDVVRVHVEDQGIGIAPEQQARIWSRFERAVSARHYAGLGLGLWIVREIIDAIGGRVRVRSDPGRGSVFTVELPREPR